MVQPGGVRVDGDDDAGPRLLLPRRPGRLAQLPDQRSLQSALAWTTKIGAGIVMVCLALCADAVIGNLQEKVMRQYSLSNDELVSPPSNVLSSRLYLDTEVVADSENLLHRHLLHPLHPCLHRRVGGGLQLLL